VPLCRPTVTDAPGATALAAELAIWALITVPSASVQYTPRTAAAAALRSAFSAVG
jgi:hypothetical protein